MITLLHVLFGTFCFDVVLRLALIKSRLVLTLACSWSFRLILPNAKHIGLLPSLAYNMWEIETRASGILLNHFIYLYYFFHTNKIYEDGNQSKVKMNRKTSINVQNTALCLRCSPLFLDYTIPELSNSDSLVFTSCHLYYNIQCDQKQLWAGIPEQEKHIWSNM